MRIAVTGHSGFIGAAAISHAERRGHQLVRVLRPGARKITPADRHADLADTASLFEIASSVDAVLHCAASEDPAARNLSKDALHALLNGLPPGGRFVMQGGSAVFGDTGPEPVKEPEFRPPPALASRAWLEQQVLQAKRHDVRSHIVYGSLIYGGARAAIPEAMIRAALNTGAAVYFGDGDQVWSTAHVDDFGRLLVDALECDTHRSCKLFAAGHAILIRQVSAILSCVLGVPSRPVANSQEADAFGTFSELLQINQHFCSESERARFGWRPDYSDDAELLIRELAFHAAHFAL
ncbi:NAD-dependent epimerase/dehydratase family protein [Leisingera sp. D0M16]|uniref:NAD-dependent epimerase/dehydratase family protein n=1 Tax=Leisingera coralii TaxID=3351347 RepID=UPI003B774774